MDIHSSQFSCSKSYEDFPCSHRQWRHDGHCRFVHGYSRTFTFWFAAKELDKNGFVVDFSGLKPLEKRLKEQFDHTFLVNSCLLYTSPSPRDLSTSRMPSSA